MIDFSILQDLNNTRGVVTEIKVNGKVRWKRLPADAKVRYVSMGDSIAVGHQIDPDWEENYGWDAQYGEDGRTATTIIPGSYTALIRSKLIETYGAGYTSTKSFAHSGDRVSHLLAMLDHDVVRSAVAMADIVTICIGANDVLSHVQVGLAEYIKTGDLSTLDKMVEDSLAVLADDSRAASYWKLFAKLDGINPNAKYVFTTVYNPYKYIWVEKGTWDNDYEDSFFAPLFKHIPQITIMGSEWDREIKKAILDADAVSMLFDRINGTGKGDGLGGHAERYVTQLNKILREKVVAYQAVNPNFLLAETKAVFDPVPDRPNKAASLHYNDLVNVEITRGYDVSKLPWGALWDGNILEDWDGNRISDKVCNDATTFWTELLDVYMDGINIDYNGLASTLVSEVALSVLALEIDPHPEPDGHYAMMQSFAEALGWSTIPRRTVTFVGNGGSGAMDNQVVTALDGHAVYANLSGNAFSPPGEGYYFKGWNTAPDGTGTAYSDKQYVALTGDLTLYAQWSKQYTVTVRHSYDSSAFYHSSSDTGPMERYAIWINGVEEPDLGEFRNPARVYQLDYGTSIGVIVGAALGAKDRPYITWKPANGEAETVARYDPSTDDARWGFTVTGNLDIHFEWNYWLSNFAAQSYWNCYIEVK